MPAPAARTHARDSGMLAAPRTMPVSTPVRLTPRAALSALGAAAGLIPGWLEGLAVRLGEASAAEADMPTEAVAAHTAAQMTKARRARERLVTR